MSSHEVLGFFLGVDDISVNKQYSDDWDGGGGKLNKLRPESTIRQMVLVTLKIQHSMVMGVERGWCRGLGGDPLLFYKTLVRRVMSEKRCLRRAGRQ